MDIKTDKAKMKEFMKMVKSRSFTYRYVKNYASKLINDNVDISTQDNDGKTLLHLAILLHDIKLVKLFLELGVNPNIANENKQAPIHLAVLDNRLDIIKLLKMYNADLEIPCELEQTPLHLAVNTSNLEIIKYLIEQGADMNIVDENCKSVLDYAIDEKNVNILKYFLSLGLDEDHRLVMNSILKEKE